MPAISPTEKAVIKYAAKSVGTAYFGPVGGFVADGMADAVVDYINANDGNAKYQAEVISRLTAIEAKLDELRNFVVHALPGIVYTQALAADLTVEKNNLIALRVSAEIALQKLKTNPGDKGLQDDVDDHADAVLTKGYALGLLGLPMLGPVLETVTLGIMCYSALMEAANNDQDQDTYRVALRGWGDKFRLLTDSWGGPLPVSLAGDETQLAAARHVLSTSPTPASGVPFFVLRYDPTPEVADGPFSNCKVYTWRAIVGYIDRKTPDGRFTGMFDRSTTVDVIVWDHTAAADVAAVQLPGDFTKKLMSSSSQYPLLLDWAMPITPPTDIPTWFNEVCNRFNAATSSAGSIPPRIAATKELLTSLGHMQRACTSLATLPQP